MRIGTPQLWIIWLALSLMAGGALAAVMFVGGSREVLLIGETTGVHHQMEMACESCHTTEIFAEEKTVNKAMNKACLSCHEAELDVSNDSHPVKKFRDPRNVARLEKLNALYCHTCHQEHRPEITRPVAVTLPTDYCLACHQDVFENRPTHVGSGFETCASAGCHNYHDNTALYEKFLLTHADAPDFAEHAVMAFAAEARGPSPVEAALTADDPMAELEAYLADLERAPDDPAAEAEEMLGRRERVGAVQHLAQH
ncbi:MAG: cytochrome c3 family protein, partial [Pseudomonadota bacterium]